MIAPEACADTAGERMIELLARDDGVHFSWTNLPSRGAVRPKAYPAESGKIGYQSANFQGVKDQGPIVEGEYTAHARINPASASFLPTSDEKQACRLAVKYPARDARTGARP